VTFRALSSKRASGAQGHPWSLCVEFNEEVMAALEEALAAVGPGCEAHLGSRNPAEDWQHEEKPYETSSGRN
jgi:hypothetical protein